MCIGIPRQLAQVDGTNAVAADGSVLDLSLVGTQPVGTWVLDFLGAAREVISAEEAQLIGKAVNAVRAIMAGGDAGDAFADLEATGPRLPEHLAAALAAGQTIA